MKILTPSAYNMYSPEVVKQGDKFVMYAGGWMRESDKPHDAIWRAVLNRRGVWNNWRKVLIPTPELYQINDPVVVQMNGYLIMYMTGNSSFDPQYPTNDIYFATSWEGLAWSRPNLLIRGYWLPSVTKKDGHVYLFATPTWAVANVFRFDLGDTGVDVKSPIMLSMPILPHNFVNVDVMYLQNNLVWQMLAENLEETNASTFISYLYSWDGIHYLMGNNGKPVITAPAGGSVRTPSMYDNAYHVYFAQSSTRDGGNNKICFQDWS